MQSCRLSGYAENGDYVLTITRLHSPAMKFCVEMKPHVYGMDSRIS